MNMSTGPLPDFSEWLVGDRLVIEEQNWERDKSYARKARFLQDTIEYYRLSNPTILELGCGSGWLPKELAATFKAPFRYLGVDKNPGCIELARRKNQDVPYIHFVESDIRVLTTEKVDVVCAFDALKHFGLHEWGDIFRRFLDLGQIAAFNLQISDGASFDNGDRLGFHHVFVTWEMLHRILEEEYRRLVRLEELHEIVIDEVCVGVDYNILVGERS